jgi:hypothetical protein
VRQWALAAEIDYRHAKRIANGERTRLEATTAERIRHSTGGAVVWGRRVSKRRKAAAR